MRLAVWQTDHSISQVISKSLTRGFNADLFNVSQIDEVDFKKYEAHIAYGVLRGTTSVFERVNHWFEVDLGFSEPQHYSGKYRISYRGTQAKYDSDYECAESHITLEPLRYNDGYILICPPTDYVCEFFKINKERWLYDQIRQCGKNWIVRTKDDPKPISWNEVKAVVTFNSSVGWEAVRRGIPCISDENHSTVGSYYKKSIDFSFSEFYNIPREPLFNFMNAHQFTLQEFEQGKAWEIIKHGLACGSDTIHGKLSVAM